MMKWVLFIPELYYVLIGLVFFILSLSKEASSKRLHGIAMTLAGIGVLVTVFCARQTGMVFFDAYRVDIFSQIFKLLLSLGTFWVISSCNELKGIDERRHPEFYFLIFICTLGMMMLVSAVELLTIYVAIELSSYTLSYWSP